VHEPVHQTDLVDPGGQGAAQVLPTVLLHPEAMVTLQAPHHHKEIMVAMVFLFPRVEQVPGVVEAALAQLVLMALLAKVEPAVLVHLPQFLDPL